MILRALSMLPCLSKEQAASTSVETLPGTMFRISLPNWTRRKSKVCSTCSSVLALLLAVGDGIVHELRVLGLLGCGEDQRRVGGGILRLVLADGGKVTAVTDDSGAGGLQLVERGRHDCGIDQGLVVFEDV